MANVPYRGYRDDPGGGSLGGGMNVQTDPNALGAGVARSEAGLGQQVAQSAEKMGNIFLKEQGLINETLATEAENTYIKALGNTMGKFKNTQGLAAEADAPSTIEALGKLRTDIAEKLPSENARRAFETLSTRHYQGAMMEVQGHAAHQVKVAAINASSTAADLAIASIGNPEIANNDLRFRGQMRDVNASVLSMMRARDWDRYFTVGADGNPTFADNEGGQQAKQTYESLSNAYADKAYKVRYQTIANQSGVMAAWSKFDSERKYLPASTVYEMDTYFEPKVTAARASALLDTIMRPGGQPPAAPPSGFRSASLDAPAGETPKAQDGEGSTVFNPGNMKTKRGAEENTQEFRTFKTPEDGVAATVSQIKRGYNGLTIAQAAQKWAPRSVKEPTNNPEQWANSVSRASGLPVDTVIDADNPEQMARLIQGIVTQEKSIKDRGHFTPEVIKSGVDAALSGTPAAVVSGGAGTAGAKAEIKANQADALAQIKAVAKGDHKLETAMVAELNSRTKIEELRIASNAAVVKANTDAVYDEYIKNIYETKDPRAMMQSILTDKRLDGLGQTREHLIGALEKKLTSQSKGDVGRFGDKFNDLRQRLMLPPGAPGRINSMSEILPYADSGDVTDAGLKELNNWYKERGTIGGYSSLAAKDQFIKEARAKITKGVERFGIADPAGEHQFSQFLVAFEKTYKEMSQKYTDDQIFDKDSPQYIGKMISRYERSMADITADMKKASVGGNTNPQSPAQRQAQPVEKKFDITTKEGVAKMYWQGTPEQKKQAEEIAIKNGWTGTSATVPTSQ